MIWLQTICVQKYKRKTYKKRWSLNTLIRFGATFSVEHLPRLQIGWTWRGRTRRRYPLDPRLDGIFIHLTKVCGVNTSQQWSISDQVAPRPTPIVTYLSDVPCLRYKKITVKRYLRSRYHRIVDLFFCVFFFAWGSQDCNINRIIAIIKNCALWIKTSLQTIRNACVFCNRNGIIFHLVF